jgi:outer membrane protein OmpA-like peptidoglycan-associated protein
MGMTQSHNPNNTLNGDLGDDLNGDLGDDLGDLGGILWDDELTDGLDDGLTNGLDHGVMDDGHDSAAIAPAADSTADPDTLDFDFADFSESDFATFSDLGFDDLELETPAQEAPIPEASTQDIPAQNSSTQKTQNPSAQNPSAQDRPTQDRPTQDAPIHNISASDTPDTPRTATNVEPPEDSAALDLADLNPLSLLESGELTAATDKLQPSAHAETADAPTDIYALNLAIETETAASLNFGNVDPEALDVMELHHATAGASETTELDIAELDWTDLGLTAADRPQSLANPASQVTPADSPPGPPAQRSADPSSDSSLEPPTQQSANSPAPATAAPPAQSSAQATAAIAPLAELLSALAGGGSAPTPAPPPVSSPPVSSPPAPSPSIVSTPSVPAPVFDLTAAKAREAAQPPKLKPTPSTFSPSSRGTVAIAPPDDNPPPAAATLQKDATKPTKPAERPDHGALHHDGPNLGIARLGVESRDNHPADHATALSPSTPLHPMDDAKTGDAKTGDAKTGNDQAGDDQAGDDQAGDDQAGDDQAGDDQADGQTLDAGDAGEDSALRQLQSLLVGDEVASLDSRIEQLHEASRRLELMLSDPESIIEHFSPLIARLIDRKVRDSSDEMCEAMLPIIDRLIYTRSQQDRRAMSRALAGILPDAISYQIRQSPRDIAKAIGPEISAAIREQIQLDRDSISEALSTEIGRTMKRQIEVERDAMIDALYPVIGNTISKYLKEAVQAINEKIAESMSTQGITRKFRAKMQGVSEAELILKESLPFSVKAAFLIHKSTGLIVTEAQQPGERPLEADMLAGMLTAIRSFANDCMTRDGAFSELSQIEYGGSEILLEVAGYCYVAVIVDGVPPKSFLRDLRRTLSQAVERYGRIIETYDGDPTQVPKDLKQLLVDLLVRSRDRRPTQEDLDATETKRGFPWLFVGAVVGAIALVAIPWGGWQWRNHQRAQVAVQLEAALDAAPDLSVYDLGVTWQDGQWVAQGRVPSEALQRRVTQVGEAAIADLAPNTSFVNETQAVRTIPDPAQVADDVRRTLDLLNQQAGSQLTAEYVPPDPERLDGQGHVNVRGTTRSSAEIDRVIRAITDIAGVGSVNSNLIVGIPDLPVRLYFGVESPQPVAIDTRGKVTPVRTFLDRYPDLNLRIVGYSPPNEPNSSEVLASQRAQAVRDAFVNQGISPDRLEVEGRLGFPADVSPSQPDWMGRCVLFEAIGRAQPSP